MGGGANSEQTLTLVPDIVLLLSSNLQAQLLWRASRYSLFGPLHHPSPPPDLFTASQWMLLLQHYSDVFMYRNTAVCLFSTCNKMFVISSYSLCAFKPLLTTIDYPTLFPWTWGFEGGRWSIIKEGEEKLHILYCVEKTHTAAIVSLKPASLKESGWSLITWAYKPLIILSLLIFW